MIKVTNKRAKTATILALSLILVMGVTYLARGWIRVSVIPAYADIFYRPSVRRTFDSDFTPLNQRFQNLGLRFGKPNYDKCWGENASFKGLRESFNCFKQQKSEVSGLTDDFIKNWQVKSPELEQYLKTAGWNKDAFLKRPLSQIFDGGYPIFSYAKWHGKTYCDLSINYDSQQRIVRAQETCSRDIKFFGGY